MGSTERKAREKVELRQFLLEAAMKLFVEKGIDNVTIRSIADATEYSVGTIYVYFKDKNAILHALHTQGFSELRSRFQVLQVVANPMERLKAIGHIYIQFAREEPAMYDLIFNSPAPLEFVREWADDEWNEGNATFGFLRAVVQDCVTAGHFSNAPVEALSFMIWGTVHGMCSLVISQRCKVVSLENPVEQGYAVFLQMLDPI